MEHNMKGVASLLVISAMVTAVLGVENVKYRYENASAYVHANRIGEKTLRGNYRVLGAANEYLSTVLFQLQMGLTFAEMKSTIETTPMPGERGLCRLLGYQDRCDHPWGNENGDDWKTPLVVDFAILEHVVSESTYGEYPDLQVFPLLAVPVVPIVNLDHGTHELILTPELLGRIFRQCDVDDPSDGDEFGCAPDGIFYWNDSSIVALNPGLEAVLQGLGRIQVCILDRNVLESSVFYQALSEKDLGFQQQINGSTSVSESGIPMWDKVRANVFTESLLLGEHVSKNPGSIGYVSYATALTEGLNIAKLLRESNNITIEASPDTFVNAINELGMAFGNDGTPPARLTAKLVNANHPNAWPFLGYAYFAVRTKTTRQGGSCDTRAALLGFMEYLYIEPSTRSIIQAAHLIPVGDVLAAEIYEHAKATMMCRKTNHNITTDIVKAFQEERSVQISLYFDETAKHSLSLASELFAAEYQGIIDTTLTSTLDDLASFYDRHRNLPQIAFTTESEWEAVKVEYGFHQEDPSEFAQRYGEVPLGAIAIAIVYDLCGPLDYGSCEANEKVDLRIDPYTLGKVLDGDIRYWDDPKLTSFLTDEEAELLPHEPIVITRSTSDADLEWERAFIRIMNKYKPGFGLFSVFANGFRPVRSSKLIVSGAYNSSYSIAIVPWVSKLETRPVKVLQLLSGKDRNKLVIPKAVSVARCFSKREYGAEKIIQLQQRSKLEETKHCYPLVETVKLVVSLQFKGAYQCKPLWFYEQKQLGENATNSSTLLNQGDSQSSVTLAEATMLFLNWLGKSEKVQPSLEVSQGAFLPAFDESFATQLREVRNRVTCNGIPVVPIEDQNLMPSGIKGFLQIMALVVIGICIALMAWIQVNVEKETVVNSGPMFLRQIVIGVAFCIATVFAILHDDRSLLEDTSLGLVSPRETVRRQQTLDMFCWVQPLVYSWGLTLVSVPLLLKQWRFKVLLDTEVEDIEDLNIGNETLIRYEAVVFSFVSALNFAWLNEDPLRWERIPLKVDENGFVTESIGRCTCESSMGWLTPFILIVIICLAYGCYLSFKTRSIPNEYAEGKYLAFMLLNYLEAILVCAPVVLASSEKPVVDKLVKSLFIIVSSLAILFLLFLPKLIMFVQREGLFGTTTRVGPGGKLTTHRKNRGFHSKITTEGENYIEEESDEDIDETKSLVSASSRQAPNPETK